MSFLKITAVFFMAASVGVLYRIPRRSLAYTGLMGVTAWTVAALTIAWGGHVIVADFFGSVAVGLLAELLARLLKQPATIFIIPGFIPLVPGGEAYTTMLYMVKGLYVKGLSMGMRTTLIGSAIAFGLFTSSTLYRLCTKQRD